MTGRNLWYFTWVISLVFFSCEDDNDNNPKDESNGIILNLVEDPTLNGDPSFEAEIELSDLELTVFDAATSQSAGVSFSSDNLSDTIDLEPGSYFVEATNGEDQKVDFEAPLFTGVTDVFVVQKGVVEVVELEVSQANVRTSVTFESVEMSLLGEEDFSVTISSPEGSLVFDEEESRAGYFSEGLELIVSLSPEPYAVSQTINTTSAGDNFQIKVEVSRGNEPTSVQVDNINQIITFSVQIPDPVKPIDSGSSFNIWSGPDVVFTKLDDADPSQEGSQDRITDNVWLTRGNDGGQLYNVITESTANQTTSPDGTEWARGTTSDIVNLQFAPLRETIRPRQIVGQNLVLHLIEDDIYIDIQFTSWSTNRGGGFQYVRSSE